MREIDIRQVAVNNHIYNLKKKELDKNQELTIGNDNNTYYKDNEKIDQVRKYIDSGAYVLNYEPIFVLLFSTKMFKEGFLNFLKKEYLNDKEAYTTATGNLILQDVLNVMYLKENVNFEKYSYVLSETNEKYITDKEQQLNKKLILTLPEGIGMLSPNDELVNVIKTIGWKNLYLMITLINKVNIQSY